MAIKASDLTREEAWLLNEMQRLNFGEIRGLVVRHGYPAGRPRPVFVRSVKFGADYGPRPELQLTDFELKTPVIELFQFLKQLGDGEIDVLKVQHGLPVHLELRDTSL